MGGGGAGIVLHDMYGSPEISGDVNDAIWLCAFAMSLVVFEKLLSWMGGAGLLGYLFAGLIFGPQLVNVVPKVDTIRVLGRIGVAFLLLEAGLHLDGKIVRELGFRAFGLTVAGMSAPLFGAIAVMYILGYDDFMEAFSVGACFMPTSVGMSVAILEDFNELDTFSGQMIVVVAMIDDILSLVVLAVLEQLGGDGEVEIGAAIRPLIASIAFAAVLLPWAIWHQTWLVRAEVKYLAWRRKRDEPEGAVTVENDHQDTDISRLSTTTKSDQTDNPLAQGLVLPDEGAEPPQPADADDKPESPSEEKTKQYKYDFCLLLFNLMMLEGFVAGCVTCVYSTELLGVFFVGFAYSTSHDMHLAFEEHGKQLIKWLAMAFFASLGFSVPLQQMMTWKMFGFGLAMTVPAVLGKVLTGMLFMKDKSRADGCKVGWGRVGRGEFAFYLADVAFHSQLMGAEAYAITIWALMNGSMGFPFAFRQIMQMGGEVQDSDDEDAEEGANVFEIDSKKSLSRSRSRSRSLSPSPSPAAGSESEPVDEMV